jgi:predicted nucleic acid-binding Zn ribbon protein
MRGTLVKGMHAMATDDVRRPGAKGQPAGPQAIGRIMSRLLARTGYDREQASESLTAAWNAAVPEPLAAHCRPGRVRRGVLEVFVSHSAISQEFSFHKAAVIARLKAALPSAAITDIRCRLADTPTGP